MVVVGPGWGCGVHGYPWKTWVHPGNKAWLQNVSYEGLNGNSNSKVCEGIAYATSILLTDFVSFGLALNFLSGNGENPLRTPVLSVKQTGLTSVTQQTLWGMAGAYKFSYPSASVSPVLPSELFPTNRKFNIS